MKLTSILLLAGLTIALNAKNARAQDESNEFLLDDQVAQAENMESGDEAESSLSEEGIFQDAVWHRPDFCRHSKMAPLPRNCFRPKVKKAED